MRKLKRLFRFSYRDRDDISADVRDEIAFHLEMRVQELIARGWSREHAWCEARRQFGDVATTADYCRRLDGRKERKMRVRLFAAELWQDLAYGLRLLGRQPAHAAVALLTIALGIGATTVVFSIVHAALLAPLPYAYADRLVVFRTSLPDYADVREAANGFEDAGAWASNLYTMDDDEQVRAAVVSPGFFTTLGVPPEIGRVLLEGDDAVAAVVLGHGLWQRRFGGAPDIVGRTIVLNGTAYTIVGVMPARFQFPLRDMQLWTSMGFGMAQAPQQGRNRTLRIFQVVGRLRPDMPIATAQAQLSSIANRLAAAHPDTNQGVTFTLVPIQERLVGNVRTALLVALGCVACLLFIACANVAGLTLARMSSRTHELAVRAAIGAGRWRISRQLLVESLLTTACGGAAGILLAWLGLKAVPWLAGGRIPRVEEVSLNLPVLGVAIAAIVAGGLLVAAVPVLHLSLTEIEAALRGSSRGAGESRSGVRLRSTLVVAQIAVAVIVLSGALVLGRSLVRLLHADAGFVSDRLLTFNVPLIGQLTPEARSLTAARVLDEIAALPGVESVGGATGLAPVTAQRGTLFEIEGQLAVPVDQRRGYFIAASQAYFRTLGTRIVNGREFSTGDTATAPRVAVVSQALAQRFFPGGDAIGKRLRLVNPEQSREWRTIVGVVANIRYNGLDDVDPPVVYTPFTQTPFLWIYVDVRTKGDPAALVGSIRSAIKSLGSRLAVANPQPMAALVSDSSADPRFRATLVSLFAAVSVVLAAVGLHGVIAFAVARRTREVAIRLALGASPASVRGRVVGQALALTAIGLVAGLVGAVGAGRLLNGLLVRTTSADSAALGAVAVLLLVVAIVASAVPARRATRIQPVEALRDA